MCRQSNFILWGSCCGAVEGCEALFEHEPDLRALFFSFGPGSWTAQLAQLLGDLETGVNIEEYELLIQLPSGPTGVGIKKVVLESCELRRMFLIPICQ